MESKNLFIRKSIFQDCELFVKWEQNIEVNRFFSLDETRSYEDVVTEFIEGNQDKTMNQFTITRMSNKEPIGRIVITNISEQYDSLNIDRIYLANEKDRENGLGEEALRLILDYAFKDLHMERVTMDYFPDNLAAQALCEKIGFKKEGIMRHSGKKVGKYIDLQLVSLIRSEYYSNVYE